MESKNIPIQRESTHLNQLYSSPSQEKTFFNSTDRKISLVASIMFGGFSSSLATEFSLNLQRIMSQRGGERLTKMTQRIEGSSEVSERLTSPDQEQEHGEVSIEAETSSGADESLTLDVNAEPLDEDGRTPLAAACLSGDLDAVENLVKSGANIEALDLEGRTPLALACFCDNVDVMEVLLKAGANIDAVDYVGMTPLATACEDGNMDVIEILLKAGANIEVVDNDGKTPLAIACCIGKPGPVDKLLEVGANVDAVDLRGMTPLAAACEDGNLSIVKKLMKAGANREAIDNINRTPLIIATRRGNKSIIGKLLKAGVNIETANKDGKTALALACTYGNVDVIDMLLKARANIETTDVDGRTPLALACIYGKLEAIDVLLKAGANIEANDKNGRSPLRLATIFEKPDVMDRLLKADANIEAKDKEGETALIGVCSRGKTQFADKLLQAGAKIETFDKNRRTPLALACVAGNFEVVGLLLDAGANINAIDNSGRTPLIIACLLGELAIAENLLARGAKVDEIDDNGNTALSFAMTSPVFKETSVIDELKTKDRGVTHELMLCKELAHRFGIEGTVKLLGEEFSLIGWRLAPAQALLSSKVHSYYTGLSKAIDNGFPEPADILPGQEPNVWSNIYSGLSATTQELINDKLSAESLKKILNDTEQAIEESLPTSVTEVQQRADEGKPVGLFMDMKLGPEQRSEHAVSMAFMKVGDKWRVARCNKGYGCGDKPGIVVHTTTDPFDPSKYYPAVSEDFHLHGFERDLSLTDEVHIRQKYQKVGNCTVANSNGMELALLYLQLEQILGHAAALELAQAIKKERCEDSREGTLKEYNDYHATHREIPPNVELLEKIQQKIK
jgi:ankyrin repeat protein